MAIDVAAELVEVMHVEHHVELPSQGALDRGVDAVEERAVDPVRGLRVRVRGPGDRQPDEVEPGLAHHVEVPVAQPAADVDPARHRRSVCVR